MNTMELKEFVRPKKGGVYMQIAHAMASLSTCNRARVGCVLIKEGRIIASGYNGSISGEKHCDDIGHLMQEGHCIRTIHAEQNALMICAKYGISVLGATAFCTTSPCAICTKLLKQAGIREIVFDIPYRIDENPFKNHISFVNVKEYD